MTYVYKAVKVVGSIHDELYNKMTYKFKEKHLRFGHDIYVIIKLGIPKRAKIVIPEHLGHYDKYTKCRCDKAKFVKVEKTYLISVQSKNYTSLRERTFDMCDITDYINKKYDTKNLVYVSYYDSLFEYKFNEYVQPKFKFNDDIRMTCGSGIHFFKSIEETKAYIKDILIPGYDYRVKERKNNGIFSEDRN